MTVRYPSEDVDPTPLSQPLQFAFSGRTAPNRFLKSAMTERLCTWSTTDLAARGIPTTELVNVYRRWGEGAVGMLISGNVMIDYEHIEAAGNAIIPRDAKFEGERFEGFRDVAREAKRYGSLLVAQVSHPGRQVPDTIQEHPISASDIHLKGTALGATFAKPRAATHEDIKNVVQGFAHAAEYLERAGFDGIQLHGAHGYLLAQFLSRTTNKRTDAYGGSLRNRARLVVEIGQAIRKVTSPRFILGIKLNSVEWQEGGFDVDEAREVCKILEENTFDFVELSGGTYEKLVFHHERESTKKREAFFIEFAEKIVPGLSRTKVYVTGGFKTVGAMVKALDTVDGIGIARPLCQEPVLCREILEGRVKGAVEQKIDLTDISLTTIAAGAQIRQLGKNQEPIDLGDEKSAEVFMRELAKWMETQKKRADASGGHKKEPVYGFLDLPGPGIPGYVEAKL